MEEKIKPPAISNLIIEISIPLAITSLTCLCLSIYFFGWYSLIFSVGALILFTHKEDASVKFVLLNYNFLEKIRVNTLPQKNGGAYLNQFDNKIFLKSMQIKFPKIKFIISETNIVGGAEAFFINDSAHIRIDKSLLDVLGINEVEFILYHEVGHIYHKHNKTMRRVFLLGYSIFILFPPALPIFWIIGNHLDREHEYEADAFAASQTSFSNTIKLFEDRCQRTFPNNPWREFFTNYVSDYPSPKKRLEKIITLQRLTHKK